MQSRRRNEELNMAKKRQKSPRKAKPTRAERQATRKKDKGRKRSEKETAPSLQAGLRGAKEPQKPVRSSSSKRAPDPGRRPRSEREEKDK
jgi:hypothetical protein